MVLRKVSTLLPIVGLAISFSAHSAPGKSYKDDYGRDCVYVVDNIPGYPFQPSATHAYYYFMNRCLGTFSIKATLNNGKKVSNGIGPMTKNGPGTSHITCNRAAGECGQVRWEAD